MKGFFLMYANLRKLIIAVKKPDIFIYEYIYIPSGSDPYVEKSIQHDVIKFVSDLRQVFAFLRVLRFPPTIKLTTTV
jgi:hypothetical protein